MSVLIKLWEIRAFLLYMPISLFFCLKYLPFKQAIKLPIWLYKPRFVSLKGNITIDNSLMGVRTGMIRLGGNRVFTYPNNGVALEILRDIVFRGKCIIGNNCNISVGTKGHLLMGNNVMASAAVTIICHHKVQIGDNVLIGWETKIMDTDFHQLKSEPTIPVPKAYNPVKIGDGTWLATQCLVLQGSEIPNNCVLGACSMTNRPVLCSEHSLLAGRPAKVIKTGVWLDCNDDSITYN